MEQLRCTYCGGTLQDHGDHYICESCRTKNQKTAMELLSEQDIFDLNAARRLKETFRFDEAQAAYDQVLRRNPACEEAAWGAFLSEYGIEYQIEEQKPTFHALSAVPVYKSRYYDKLSPEHQHEADEAIEFKRREIMKNAETLPSYDVFLSLKIDGEGGAKTPEYEWAMQLYYDLREQGYKVFFSPQVLKTTNADWEPYIYRAIQTCRIMLVLTSSIDNANSPWVRNEWRRILSRIKNTPAGEQKPVYRVIAADVNCVPPELTGKQVLLHGDMHLLEMVKSAVKEACGRQRQNANASNSSSDSLNEANGQAGSQPGSAKPIASNNSGLSVTIPLGLDKRSNYHDAEKIFRNAGFSNIRLSPLNDMTADKCRYCPGTVVRICVCGEEIELPDIYEQPSMISRLKRKFWQKKYPCSTEVLIFYHSIAGVNDDATSQRIWTDKKKKEKRRTTISTILVFSALIAMIGLLIFWDYCDSSSAIKEIQTYDENTIVLPFDNSDFSNVNYLDAISQFHSAGFVNIELVPIEDLITGWLTSNGEVERITIDGSTDFEKGTPYAFDVKVTISYHTFSDQGEALPPYGEESGSVSP